VQLETNTADEHLRATYDTLMNGSQNEIAFVGKLQANMYFIKNMVLAYLKLALPAAPVKLAFDMDDSEVLIWAEIEDDNEEKENQLLLAEADINAKFHEFGYDLTSTIVECRDNLQIPNHYIIFK